MNTPSSILHTPKALLSSRLMASKWLSPKLWLYVGMLVMAMILVLMGQKAYEAQPNQIVINTDNLSIAEYEVLHAATSTYAVNGFFTTPLPEIQRNVMGFDWVSQVNVARKWHEGIVVTVLPRQAVARFGSEQLIDSQGAVFKPVLAQDLLQPDLIMLQGDPGQSTLIMQQMQQINQWFLPLGRSVKDMVLTPRMTWVIKFDNGLRVVVDNERTSQKLMNLSQLLQSQLKDKRADIASVDLRYKNGFVIEWQPSVIQNSMAKSTDAPKSGATNRDTPKSDVQNSSIQNDL